MAKGKLFVVSAPSGAGKTTLTKEAIKRLENNFDISKVITYTTRPPRDNEKNGIDYHFVSVQKFADLLEDDFFLEATKYSGNLYGSPRTILEDLESGKSFVIVTDLNGLKEIKKHHLDGVLLWVTAPSLEELKTRLIKRKTNEKQMEKRLKLAEEEMDEAKKSRLFDYNVVNDNFDQTVQELVLIIENKLKEE